MNLTKPDVSTQRERFMEFTRTSGLTLDELYSVAGGFSWLNFYPVSAPETVRPEQGNIILGVCGRVRHRPKIFGTPVCVEGGFLARYKHNFILHNNNLLHLLA